MHRNQLGGLPRGDEQTAVGAERQGLGTQARQFNLKAGGGEDLIGRSDMAVAPRRANAFGRANECVWFAMETAAAEQQREGDDGLRGEMDAIHGWNRARIRERLQTAQDQSV
jgi:hypothetical protein